MDPVLCEKLEPSVRVIIALKQCFAEDATILDGWSANLTLPDYGRVARHPHAMIFFYFLLAIGKFGRTFAVFKSLDTSPPFRYSSLAYSSAFPLSSGIKNTVAMMSRT